MEKKTLAEHLRQASDFFDSGYVVKAGQIWQAILKRDSSNGEARAGLLKVRDVLTSGPDADISAAEPHTLPPPEDLATPVPADEAGHFLREGCSLYDSGALTEALAAWEKVLVIEPEHGLALSHVRGVRKELGLPILEIEKHAEPLMEADSKGSENEGILTSEPNQTEIDWFIDQGSHLYKIGKIAGAIHTWESALAIDPENVLTKGYLAMARAELEAKSGKKPLPGSIEASPFRQSVSSVPPSECRQSRPIPNKTPADLPINIASEPKSATKLSAPQVSDPQSAPGHGQGSNALMPSVITKRAELTREGPSLSKKVKKVPILSRLLSPITLVVLLLLTCGGGWLAFVNRDAILNAAQAAIKEEAIKSAHQSVKVVNLAITPEELKSQAKSALNSSPLRSYLLVQEVISRDPSDTTVAKLFEQAQQAMQSMATLPTQRQNADLNRLIASGNLEEAETLVETSLRQNPNNQRTRENLARVSLLLAREFAKQGKWESARSRLLMGAALFPKDLTWQARLKLLENLQTTPANLKEEQSQWYELLG